MNTHEDENIIQEKIDGLLKDPPDCKLPDEKRTEFIARLYKVSEERKSVISFAYVRNAAVGAALLTLIISFNYLFSPLYPTVANIKGTVKVYRSGQNEWVFAKGPNIRLHKDDILKTFADGQADLIIPKVYHIRLKSDSEIMLAKACSRAISKDMSYTLNKGKVLTYFNKNRAIGRELGIETPQAIATALGTDFMVESTPILGSTWVGVFDGTVRVNPVRELSDSLTRFSNGVNMLPPINIPKEAMQGVLVKAGEKTTVRKGESPAKPARLMENELLEMEELYNIGTRPQVALLITTGPTRTRELLSVIPLYISSEKPGVLPKKIEAIAREFSQAIKQGSKEKHMDSIKQFEAIVNEYPNPKYDVQFLLFIGAYYEYVDEHGKAISTFQRVVDSYPNSSLASIAQCAIGIIYEEKLKDIEKAKIAYKKVISNYPQSPEAEEAQAGLSR